MKIAVLITGEYREFPNAHKLWSFLKWSEVDTYFVTWDKTSVVYMDRNNPVVRESVTDRDIFNFISPKKHKILDSSYQHNFATNSGSMLYLWQQGLELLESSNENYDFVILIRPDLGIQFHDNILKDFFERKIQSSDRVIYLINSVPLENPQIFGIVEAVPDMMIVGTPNALLKIKHMNIDKFYVSKNSELIDVHKFLAKEYIKFYDCAYNLPIEDWCIVRSNSRLSASKTFEDYKEDSRIWWETYHKTTGVSPRKNLTSSEINFWMGI
jgi:hypothetical protein